MRIERVGAEVVGALRHQVLRPGRPAAESFYGADDDPGTIHIAAFLSNGTTISPGLGTGIGTDAVVAVGTAVAEAAPWDRTAAAWRVRGMATQPDRRGGGLGTRVLAALLDAATVQGAAIVWCNARVPACLLYERAGFVTRGAVFEIPVIGPHVVMWRSVGLCQGIGGVPDGTCRDHPPNNDAI